MKTIRDTYTIHASAQKVWDALTQSDLIDTWGAGPSIFDAKEGGQFSLWGGDIHGTNTRMVPNKLIEEDWYGHDNPERCYKISFALSEVEGVTTIELIHKDIPENEFDDFRDGWKDYYFDPIKELLEQ